METEKPRPEDKYRGKINVKAEEIYLKEQKIQTWKLMRMIQRTIYRRIYQPQELK
jgi:hypothetical protein